MKYVPLDRVNPDELLSLLNKTTVRRHLVNHAMFNSESFEVWLDEKRKMDLVLGCRVRAVVVDERCVGWCGIQLTDNEYEISIVLDEDVWGLGLLVYRELMKWAREFRHPFILIHLLDSRPEYEFLKKRSKRLFKTEIFNQMFNTYLIEVLPERQSSQQK